MLRQTLVNNSLQREFNRDNLLLQYAQPHTLVKDSFQRAFSRYKLQLQYAHTHPLVNKGLQRAFSGDNLLLQYAQTHTGEQKFVARIYSRQPTTAICPDTHWGTTACSQHLVVTIYYCNMFRDTHIHTHTPVNNSLQRAFIRDNLPLQNAQPHWLAAVCSEHLVAKIYHCIYSDKHWRTTVCSEYLVVTIYYCNMHTYTADQQFVARLQS